MTGLVNEPTQSPGIAAALRAGIQQISSGETVAFTQYRIVRMQQDGYVFWVAGASQDFAGSLHVGVNLEQSEESTIGVNSIAFTAPQEVTQFNDISPTSMWAATVPSPGGTSIYLAFRSRGRFYETANLWHYRGEAIYPTQQTQLVSSAVDLPSGPIVSNSIPIWLAQATPALPLYPSYLVPANILPPYGVIHVSQTQPLNPFPYLVPPPAVIDPTPAPMYGWASNQLLCDRGRVTLYGLTSQQATQFEIGLFETSRNTDVLGFMDSPVLYDEHDAQPELQAIAMRKTMEFQISYYLSTADAIARRFILSASVSTTIN